MKLDKLLFSLGIILIPFYNDFPLFPESHLLRSPSNIFLLLLIFSVFVNKGGRFRFKSIYFKRSIVIILLSFLSLTVNLLTRSGYQAILSIKLLIILSFFLLVMHITFSFLKKIRYVFLAKLVLISFIPVLLYAFIEIGDRILKVGLFQTANQILEPILHDRIYQQGARVRGFAFEPSYFSLVLCFIFPWLLYYVQKTLKFKWILSLFFIVVYFTYSRAAYLIIIGQILLFLVLSILNGKLTKFQKGVFFSFPIVLLVTVPFWMEIVLSLFEFRSTNISNLIRFSSMLATINLGIHNPILGVGLGQSGFYLTEFYPDFIWSAYNASNWVHADTSMGSPTFSLLPSIFSDLGILGLFAFLSLWLYPIKSSLKLVFRKQAKPIDLILIILNIGLLVGSFGVDGFTFVGYWVMMGICYFRTYQIKLYTAGKYR